MEEKLKPFSDFSNTLKQWNIGRFTQQDAYPEHEPVITRQYPCDEKSSYVLRLYVDHFKGAEKALTDYQAHKEESDASI